MNPSSALERPPLFGRSRRLWGGGQQMHSSTHRSRLATSVFVRASPAHQPHGAGSIWCTPSSNLTSKITPSWLPCVRRPSPPCACTRGTNFTMSARSPAQESPSTCLRAVPNAKFRPRQPQVRHAARSIRMGGAAAFGAHQCVLAAGPRAISSTRRDEPGLLGYLLVLDDVLVHPTLLHLFAIRLDTFWDCSPCS